MQFMKKTAIAIAIAASFVTVGCSTQNMDSAHESQQTDMTASVTPIVLTDDAFLAKAANEHSSYTIQGNSLLVEFDEVTQAEANAKWPNMKFRPVEGSVDWNTKGGLKLKLENPTQAPIRVELKIADSIGVMGAATHQLDKPIELAAGESKTIDYLFNGSEMGMDGYRGGEELDLKTITEFQLYAVGPVAKQSLILHSIDFIERTGDFVKSQVREDVIASASVPTVLSLSQFEEASPEIVELNLGTQVTQVQGKDGKALRVFYSTDEAYPTVKFSAGTNGEAWDWSQQGDVALAFDAKNLGDKGVQLFVRVDDDLDEKLGGGATGVVHSRSGYVQLPPQSSDTYYFTLKDLAEAMNSGMRGEPPKQAFSATQVVFGWGETELDLSNIVSFQLYMMNPLADAELEFDNLRLIPNLTNDTSRYSNIIDEFGQYNAEEWPEKVADLNDLQSRAKDDYDLLESAKLLDDRSTYGGWTQGPKLNATGYFRTEKVDGKWALVDPEGYLYFATGLDNIRMDDSYTTTGIGFTDIAELDTDDLRPSQVGESGYLESTQTRAQLSPLRRGMFTDLPDYDSPLAQNYNYTQMIHTGPLKHGEVFSFYGANLQRKYQQASRTDALDIWQDVTLARMMDWGFTSLGNWSDPSFYGNGKVPYTAHGWIVGGPSANQYRQRLLGANARSV
jgi:agarase